MGNKLTGKIAVITGATSGIGVGILRCFMEEGAKAVFCGRRKEKGMAIEEELKKEGYDATFVQADVTVEADVEHAVQTACDTYGTVDIMVNNAGVLASFDFLNMDVAKDYDRVFNTNIKSYFTGCRIAAKIMAEKGSGVIINTASIGGLNGGANVASYCASKAAVISLTKSLAKELGPKGIRANSISPGLIYSEMMRRDDELTKMALAAVPMGRGGEPEEIGKVAVFLASDDASFVNGTNIVVDGGQSA